MNIRLDYQIEQKLNFFADKLHVTKTDLVKPYVMKLIEDMEDYYSALQALKEDGSVTLAELEREFANVAD